MSNQVFTGEEGHVAIVGSDEISVVGHPTRDSSGGYSDRGIRDGQSYIVTNTGVGAASHERFSWDKWFEIGSGTTPKVGDLIYAKFPTVNQSTQYNQDIRVNIAGVPDFWNRLQVPTGDSGYIDVIRAYEWPSQARFEDDAEEPIKYAYVPAFDIINAKIDGWISGSLVWATNDSEQNTGGLFEADPLTVINPDFPAWERGGIEAEVKKMSKALQTRSWEISIDRELIDTSVMGDTTSFIYQHGRVGAEGTMEVLYNTAYNENTSVISDENRTLLQDVLNTSVQNEMMLELVIGREQSEDYALDWNLQKQHLISIPKAVVTSAQIVSRVGELVTISIDFTASGEVDIKA